MLQSHHSVILNCLNQSIEVMQALEEEYGDIFLGPPLVPQRCAGATATTRATAAAEMLAAATTIPPYLGGARRDDEDGDMAEGEVCEARRRPRQRRDAAPLEHVAGVRQGSAFPRMLFWKIWASHKPGDDRNPTRALSGHSARKAGSAAAALAAKAT
eukprot:gene3943-biopygen4878